MKNSIKKISFIFLMIFLCIPMVYAKTEKCTYNRNINISGLDAAYNGSKNIDVTDIVKYCDKSYDSSKYKIKSVKGDYVTGSATDGKVLFWDLNKVKDKTTTTITINYSQDKGIGTVSHKATVEVTLVKPISIATIDKPVDLNTKNFNILDLIKEYLAKDTGNSFDESLYTFKSRQLIKNGNTGFLTGVPGDINNISVNTNTLSKQTAGVSNNIFVKFSYAGTDYQLTIKCSYNSPSNSNSSNTNTNTNTSTSSSEKACYKFSTTGTYMYGTESEVSSASQGMKYTKVTDANMQSETTCKSSNTNRKNQDEASASSNAIDSALASGISSVTEQGENSCKNYVIKRVRSYNSNKNHGISNYKDDYFKNAVGIPGSEYQYYYVYKTYYNCQGYDRNTSVTAFCIDPGASGATTSGTKYSVGKTLDQNSAFAKGLYHLYTYWYLDHSNEIKSSYSGSSPNGAEDLLDYVINNVARQLVNNYGSTAGIYFTKPGNNGGGKQLTEEYNAYKKNTVGVDAASSLKSKEILTKVWLDTKEYADGTKKEASTQTEVKFGIELNSSSTKNSKKGFEAEFTVTLQTSDKEILKNITENYKITASVVEDSVEKDISGAIKSSIDESGWQASDDGTTMTAKFKVTADDIYNYVSSDVIENVKINFNISYQDKRSIKNIMYLTSPEGSKYQKFISFLNGQIDTSRSVSVEMGKQQSNNCKPSYAMPCVDKETVVYLIEGTQSGTLFNTVMNGIKSVGDVKNVISNAYNIVQTLLNNGQSGLDDSQLKLTGGLIYNLTDKIGLTGNLKNELSFLKTLGDNGNVTAKELYSVLNNTSFDSGNSKETEEEKIQREKNNYIQLEKFIINSVLNTVGYGFDRISSDWKEIVDTAEKQVTNNKISKNTKELLENIQNLVTSAGSTSSLSNILNSAKTISDNYLPKLSSLSSLKELSVSFSSVIGGTIQSGGTLSNISNQLGTMWDSIKNVTSLSDINISGIFNSLTSAFTVDWEKCIIGEGNKEATDPNGNSYTVQAQNMYCKVVCKEDYAIKMPGNLGTVYAGENLSTNVDNKYHATIGMAGQRTCVTTKIDNDSYVKDAVEIKDHILLEYNEFQKNYAYYKELKNNSNLFKDKEKTAYNNKDIVDLSKFSLDEIKKDFNSVIGLSVNTFLTNFVKPTTVEERDLLDDLKTDLSTNLSDENGISMKLIGTYLQKGSIGADDIKTVLTASVGKDLGEKFPNLKDRFDTAISDTVTSLEESLKTIAEKYAKDGALSVVSTAGKFALSASCKILTKLPYVGPVAEAVCEAYAGVTTAASGAIIGVSEATINTLNIFAIHDYTGIILDGSYNKFKYSTDETDGVSKLKASITEKSEVANDGNLSFGKDTKQLWVMASGSYDVSTTYFGVTFHPSLLKKAFQSFQNLGNADFGVISDTLEYINNTANKIGNMKSYSSAKSAKSSLEEMQNSGMIDNIISTIGNLTSALGDITGALGNAQSDITKYVDNALDGIYYMLGAFDPYYYQVAMIREQMASAKKLYDQYREQLEKLAGNMNQCTMFDNEYSFDPDLVFTYGYPNNSLLDYIIDKKNKTVDSIRLKAINPQEEAETVTYYCKDDVPINNIQDISTIMSGKCTTSDGVFGSVVASVFGNDSQMATILNKFKSNSDGLRKLLNNDKVKEYINSTGYASKVNDFLCTGLGTSFCDLIGSEESEEGSLITSVPGDIVYTLRDTKLSSSSWGNIKSLFTGGLSDIDKNITNSLKYTTTSDFNYTYRNAKRVVSISRYGNPGVSISGLSFTSLLSNIASWISSEAGGSTSDALDKINSTVMGVTGQGAQEFIYYESSLPYFTSSNKGIYTTTKVADDSVYIDIGDKALTDDKITTADGSTKEANGLVYPIALSTAEGKYSYQIKINNVGQYYNNTMGLGRIIDNNGYVSGLLANQYVCQYNVKTEHETIPKTCQDILDSSDCKDENGYFKDLYKANYKDTNGVSYESKWNTCINKLLADNCCSSIDDNSVPDSSKEHYNKVCNTHCSGISLYGVNSSITSVSRGDSALISKNGTLQFYTKVVSNYQLFPNGEGSKGYNWTGYTSGYENKDDNGNPQPQKLEEILKDIEDRGDNSYNDDYLEYSITMNSACINAIKTYNKQQEINDLGFGDYTLGSISKESREYKSQFLAAISSNSEYSSCKIENYLK